jgi:hypothetical protein
MAYTVTNIYTITGETSRRLLTRFDVQDNGMKDICVVTHKVLTSH